MLEAGGGLFCCVLLCMMNVGSRWLGTCGVVVSFVHFSATVVVS